MSATDADAFAGLSVGERLFIWGFRAAAYSRRAGRPSSRDIRQVYDEFKLADAVPFLERMLDVFACTAHTGVELHAPGCPCVSAGEYRLLQAVATAQQGCPGAVRQCFEHWLPPISADWIIAPALCYGRILATAGLLIPLQKPQPPALQATIATGSWTSGSPTLH